VTDKKPRRGPQVEVVRRPSIPSTGKPGEPSQPAVPSRSTPPTPGRRRFGPSRPPPTPEQINALARREHVPARIARGELEGKMKCRTWRKLHAEEAHRFDQVYALMASNPTLGFEDAFGVLQSGLAPAQFLERKAKTQKKTAVKQARSAISNEAVDALLKSLIEQQAPLAVVLDERTLEDELQAVERVAFQFKRSGRREKLQVLVLARREVWERASASILCDPQLAQRPAPIIRQPERRAVSDPRPFTEHVGQAVELVLRNGLTLRQGLRAVGPYDLLVGDEQSELLVPLHAIVRWSPAGSSS